MDCVNVPVILAGGSGSRLWPLSRKAYPKQFLSLVDEHQTLLQATLLRLQGVLPGAVLPPLIICHASHRFIVAEQCRDRGIHPLTIILEPEGRNTAPAIALAAEYVKTHYGEANLWVFPADHVMAGDSALQADFSIALEALTAQKLVTFGVPVTAPMTAYGYIQVPDTFDARTGGWSLVKRFVEKPDLARAESFQKDGHYYWNSGMFAFSSTLYLEELARFAPHIVSCAQAAMERAVVDADFVRPEKTFLASPSDSIDYALMERTSRSAVVPLHTTWSDVGSWDALMEQSEPDASGNVVRGDVLAQGVENSYLHATHRLLAVSGLDQVIVVETPDAVLVADKRESQSVKKLVQQLERASRAEAHEHLKSYRPWGWFETIMEGEHFKVKRLHVSPGHALSLQRHQHRSEHWVVVKGEALVVNGEKRLTLQADESTYIPAQYKHQLANQSELPLEIIEVQTGTYLGEDDIERFADQYGRVEAVVL